MAFRKLTLTDANDGHNGRGGDTATASGTDTGTDTDNRRSGQHGDDSGNGGTNRGTVREDGHDGSETGTDATDGRSGGSGSGDRNRGGDSGSGSDDRDDATGFVADGDGSATGRSRANDEYDGHTVTTESGRHKRKQCPCPKCTQWREANGLAIQLEEPTGDPETISLNSLKRGRNFSKSVAKETLGIFCCAAFEIPTLIFPPGTADHWPLTPPEEKTLVERLDAVIDMLPKRTKSKSMDFLSKIVAPVALVTTAVLITKPRLDMTRDMIRAMRPQPGGNANAQHASKNAQPPAGGRVVGSINTETVRNTESVAHGSDATAEAGIGGNGHTGITTRVDSAFHDETHGF